MGERSDNKLLLSHLPPFMGEMAKGQRGREVFNIIIIFECYLKLAESGRIIFSLINILSINGVAAHSTLCDIMVKL